MSDEHSLSNENRENVHTQIHRQTDTDTQQTQIHIHTDKHRQTDTDTHTQTHTISCPRIPKYY